jgi:hypothetical protein
VSATSSAGPTGNASNGTADSFARMRRVYRRHLALFLGGNAGLSVVNYFVGTGWWAFWPLAAWSLILMIHYLRYKAATVDDGWVDERAAELRIKSYDRDHIENIAAHGPGAAARESDTKRN